MYRGKFNILIAKYPQTEKYTRVAYDDRARWAEHVSPLAFSVGLRTTSRVEVHTKGISTLVAANGYHLFETCGFCSDDVVPALMNGHPGFTKEPSCGKDGSKKAEVCSQHVQRGMINLVSKKWGHRGFKRGGPMETTAASRRSALSTAREEWRCPACGMRIARNSTKTCCRMCGLVPFRKVFVWLGVRYD
ncbi:unnamed protein product [Ectocarpus sp. CCAP 1310/34]|nr:unnamed protein product [Ectocarpus sp. CCAP 1310/34]